MPKSSTPLHVAMSIIEQLAKLEAASLSPETSRKLLAIRIDGGVQRLITTLAEKCNEGTLTSQERDEYGQFVHLGDLLAILQSKARLALKRVGERP